jgi:2-polyprenyl-6-methoxyphenol hydroxylase-like FAD-dependent oxidoreductase
MTTKVVVVGAGPVGSLAALYAAVRGFEVEVYELRAGASFVFYIANHLGAMLTLVRPPRPQHHAPELFQVHQSCVV